MVDVDDEVQSTSVYKPAREDLHVAGENDEIYVILREKVWHAGSRTIFVSVVISRW